MRAQASLQDAASFGPRAINKEELPASSTYKPSAAAVQSWPLWPSWPVRQYPRQPAQTGFSSRRTGKENIWGSFPQSLPCFSSPSRNASTTRATFASVALKPKRPTLQTFPAEGPRPPEISRLNVSCMNGTEIIPLNPKTAAHHLTALLAASSIPILKQFILADL